MIASNLRGDPIYWVYVSLERMAFGLALDLMYLHNSVGVALYFSMFSAAVFF